VWRRRWKRRRDELLRFYLHDGSRVWGSSPPPPTRNSGEVAGLWGGGGVLLFFFVNIVTVQIASESERYRDREREILARHFLRSTRGVSRVC
jgi:hypothetical protein